MSDDGKETGGTGQPADPEPERKPEVGERVGRALGKAFLKVKKTRVWQDTKKSYKDAIEGTKK